MALEIIGACVAVWLVYAGYVIRLIRKSGGYELAQLRNQTLIALGLPLIGAGIVQLMFHAMRAKEPPADRQFVCSDVEPDSNLTRDYSQGHDSP